MVRCGSKSGLQKDVSTKEMGITCSRFVDPSMFNNQHNWDA